MTFAKNKNSNNFWTNMERHFRIRQENPNKHEKI